MQVFYDNKPSKLEAIGNGSHVYRYNIQEVETSAQNNNDKAEEEALSKTQWMCEEVIVWLPLSANKITEKVLTEKWDSNYEQKLINEYNSAQLGILSETEAAARIEAYTEFLNKRAALKSQVDADCHELGIK